MLPKRPIEAVEALTGSQKTNAALQKLAQRTTASTALLTALVVLVARLTGDEDISIGFNGNPNRAPFVLRTFTTVSESFSSVQAKVQDAISTAREKVVPLQLIQEHLKSPALFKFAAFNTEAEGATPAATIETTDLLLSYQINTAGSLQLTARYNQRLFSSVRIAGILSQITVLLENAAADPSRPIGSINFCTPEQQKLRPDPTSDLEWSKFRGAIHDIFAANAEAHPERVCVVETPSEEHPERKFNYRQINEASNLLAHHLVNSGFEQGDVAMIYSYRGVDLVVAVMGILKAGGTFSVLDPAYPPDRQNIYLEVSQPRALIIIERATREASSLDQKVRTFIKDNLQLKTEVPSLYLHDDGNLTGGKVDGKDIFEPVLRSKAKGPGVVVGPELDTNAVVHLRI